MARSCDLCGDQLNRATIARCGVVDCPSRKPAAKVSLGKLLALFVPAALLGALLLTLGMALMGRRAMPSDSAFAPRTPSHPGALVSSGRAPEASSIEAGSGADLSGMVRLSAPDPAAGRRVQSFRCDDPASPARRLVCTHWELATIDYNLALSYRQALTDAANPRALRREQRAWLGTLDKLRKPGEVVRHYEDRLKRLSAPPA